MIKLATQARYLDSVGRHEEADAITQMIHRATQNGVRLAKVKSVYDAHDFSNKFLYSIISPNGYKIVHEKMKMFYGPKSPWVDITSAYTMDDQYIGDPKDAEYFIVKKGIKPELSHPDHNVCSIGFCDRDQKWYGWSHRAMKGFGIGDIPEEFFPGATKKGNPIQSLNEAREAAIAFAESVS